MVASCMYNTFRMWARVITTGVERLLWATPSCHTCIVMTTEATLILALTSEGRSRGERVGYTPTTTSKWPTDLLRAFPKSGGRETEDLVPFSTHKSTTSPEKLALVKLSIAMTTKWGRESPPLAWWRRNKSEKSSRVEGKREGRNPVNWALLVVQEWVWEGERRLLMAVAITWEQQMNKSRPWAWAKYVLQWKRNVW